MLNREYIVVPCPWTTVDFIDNIKAKLSQDSNNCKIHDIAFIVTLKRLHIMLFYAFYDPKSLKIRKINFNQNKPKIDEMTER